MWPLYWLWPLWVSALVTPCRKSPTPQPWIGSSPCVLLSSSLLSSSLPPWTTLPTRRRREPRENRPLPLQPVPRAPHRQAKRKTQRRFYRWGDVTDITKRLHIHYKTHSSGFKIWCDEPCLTLCKIAVTQYIGSIINAPRCAVLLLPSTPPERFLLTSSKDIIMMWCAFKWFSVRKKWTHWQIFSYQQKQDGWCNLYFITLVLPKRIMGRVFWSHKSVILSSSILWQV